MVTVKLTVLIHWILHTPSGHLLLRAGIKPMALGVRFDPEKRTFHQTKLYKEIPLSPDRIDKLAVAEAIAYAITRTPSE